MSVAQAMGSIWQAVDVALDSDVAIQFMATEFSAASLAHSRVEREANKREFGYARHGTIALTGAFDARSTTPGGAPPPAPSAS